MDTLTPQQRRERMALVKGRDTGPELRVRRAMYRMGLRYRLQARELPGRPDIVFRNRKIAVFVHGCFWHRHPKPSCKRARIPKSRTGFWLQKLGGNRKRDLLNQSTLRRMGWRVFVIWECEALEQTKLETAIARIARIT